MDKTEVEKYLMDMPDEVLAQISFSMPWQYDSGEESYKDPDGFPVSSVSKKSDNTYTIQKLQLECWEKFNQTPQVNTAVRGLVGRMTGWGFETTSMIQDIQEAIEEIELDPRNRLYDFWPKYAGRSILEGELILLLSCHTDGFVEIDFVDPGTVSDGGKDDYGIIYHPDKGTMPLFFNISPKNGGKKRQIPSIFIARYPDLLTIAAKEQHFDKRLQGKSKSRKHVFRQFGGFFQFIIYWNKGFITQRAISYLRTTIQWLNHYENLKKYEIDHKKAAGAYLWTFSFEDPKAFKIWLSLTDDERRKTAIMAKKTPGGTMILPPGMKLEVVNPKLPTITDEDDDIKELVSSGLNEPADVTTGTAKGTFASIKASRGPMSDRTSDEIAYFDRFLKYDFWGSIFFLKSKITNFPKMFTIKEAVEWKNREPVFKKLRKRPEQLVDISYPISETIDFESRAKGLLGVKHGPISETLGIPNSEVARKLGLGGYGRHRLRKATEDELYPELVYTIDAESLQEKVEGEPSSKNKDDKKKDNKKDGDQ